jgi:hypothetical protein
MMAAARSERAVQEREPARGILGRVVSLENTGIRLLRHADGIAQVTAMDVAAGIDGGAGDYDAGCRDGAGPADKAREDYGAGRRDGAGRDGGAAAQPARVTRPPAGNAREERT